MTHVHVSLPFFSLSLLVETRATAAMEADKVKHRLEQLDDLEDGGQQETLNLSQKEYIRKIDTMNKSLTDAWQRDQRVMSLKITIQVGGSATPTAATPHRLIFFFAVFKVIG